MEDPHSTRRFIKPKDGLTVRDPENQRALPPHGKGVAWNSFWQRRLDDQDVELTTEAEILAGDKAVEDAVIAAEAAAAKAEKKAKGNAAKPEELAQ